MHIEELRNDPILAFSDVICLTETWLKSNIVEEELKISGLELHLNSVGEGKGIGTYYKSDKILPKTDIVKLKSQMTLLSSLELDIVNIYRSRGMDTKEMAEDIKSIINSEKFTIVCGDFNLCYLENRSNEVTRMLEQDGFSQLVQEATHFKGGLIDHVYSNHNSAQFKVEVSLYSPYYLSKDHDAICVSIIRSSEKQQQSE